jgi:glycerol-3-phosphate dehydrogenase
MLRSLAREPDCDILVIGGGATGLGVAIDSAARGYRTVLLERGDFAQGTSSRSTKLVHGGVRYLQQGDVGLVIEALRERGLLRRNAPHLVHDLRFVVPNYDWWEAPFYGIGLKAYDLLAGKLGLGRSRLLSRGETIERLPTIETDGLRGGVLYHDAQFDDARLAVDLAMTAVEQGATVLNYAEVTEIVHHDGLVCGARAREIESGDELEMSARAVVNATGVFTDSIRRLDEPGVEPMIRASQGVHLVLARDFLPGDSAIMVPHTDDGRVLFAIPWLDRVVVGTTDTPVERIAVEPRALPEEIDFLLEHCARYLTRDPARGDVLSVFAGLRPLVGDHGAGPTAEISRDHTVRISPSGLVTIAGGKWTTYRRMAQDTVDQAAVVAGLDVRPCVTADLNIHGHHSHPETFGRLAAYGSDAREVERLAEDLGLGEAPIHPGVSCSAAEVVWAAREEMARTVEDVLARRTRALLLDARAAAEAAEVVAGLMAAELERDTDWEREQVASFHALARGYLPD